MTTDENQLQNLSQSGKPPETRLKSASACRNMYNSAKQHNAKRDARDAYVKGLVDGNPPYSAERLKATGQAHRFNFNNGEAESFLNVAITAFYDILTEVEHRAHVEIPAEVPDAPRLSDLATEQFDWLVDQDDRLDFNFQVSIHEMVLYGRGPMIWEDDLDWRSTAILHQELKLPEGAKSNIVEWDRCWIDKSYRVDELYQFIADENAAKSAGWNVEAVKKAIMNATASAYPEGGNDWMRTQRWIRENDTYAGEQSERVCCVRMLYKEFSKDGEDGEISEAWVSLDEETDDFLFQEIGRYTDWRQALNAFFYDRGDGSANGVRGLGVKMFSMLQARQRLQNAMADAAMLRSAVLLRALGSGTNAQQLSIAPVGSFVVIPTQFAVEQPNSAGALDAPLAVSRDLDNTLSANLGQYRARMEKPEGNPRTAFEVNAEIQKQTILGKTQIARYYQQLDEYWAEVFRRAVSDRIPEKTSNRWLKLALEFQRRCTERGIPLNLLRKCRVTARRTAGQGSQYVRSLALGNLFQTLYPVLPEDGKQNLTNDMIASAVGRHAVDRYNPAPPIRAGESQQRWEAQVENDTIRNRGQVTITPYQNDVIHLQEHLAFASQAAQSLQQGADSLDIYGVLQASGGHMALHLQRLATNPMRADEFKILEKQFTELAKITDQLAAQIQQMQQAQAEQAQMAQQAQALESRQDPEFRLKVAETEARLALKKQKQDGDMALKLEKQQANLEMQTRNQLNQQVRTDATTAQQMTLKNAQALQDAKLKEAKAAQEAELKATKASKKNSE